MVFVAVILLVCAISLGIYLISFLIQNKETPKGVAFIHGSFAFLGVVTLALLAIKLNSLLWISVLFLLAAAAGGFYMMFRDLVNRVIPKWLVLAHVCVAVVGVVTALLIIFKR